MNLKAGLASGVPVMPQAQGLCPAAARAQYILPFYYIKTGKSAGSSHSLCQAVVLFQAEGGKAIFPLQ